MDLLPVELLRLIFEHCDPPAVQNLRLVSSTLANVAYDYLIPPHFSCVEWRDDIKRLHSISSHARLRGSIKSATLNFARVDEYNTRHASFFQHWLTEPEERDNILRDAWVKYYEMEARGRGLPSFASQSALVEKSFNQLPNLKHLEITYTKCPYDIPILSEAFQVRSCMRWDRGQACKNMNLVVSAIQNVKLSSLTVDPLPLEIFKAAGDRKHWFDCARSFAGLSRLDLAIDSPSTLLPQSKFRAVNGLGHVLQFSPHLTHLSLRFHSYHAPREKFTLSFRAMLGDLTFQKLTDLKLEGISCAEDDLRSFLLRHGPTLERLRLGGKGLAKPYEASIGGIHLYDGSFRSLFTSLREKLPRLQRFHMEGDIEAGEIMTSSRERYKFHAITTDDWEEARLEGMRPSRQSVDCRELERYLVQGGEYPKLVVSGE
ncbi:hypothetical protein QBC33DRAFT_40610 [Phialemonium atrogriseum]|uniref:F-box domain-containing protein n=1 Tax=Phialemonium atrogriseum TaxID=1093897 RepID=A0AAJ0C151_9PEZI|nr:uncharacterized protein QBC33DRAFT_40610 [Phialemonium atrogriseum]KAK1767986.1 hypothetical protein QBC33DRAFT_40610 [Phialemonium atrogriseum]